MGMRSRLRREFPRRWWRSPPWWWGCLRQLAVWSLACAATVIFLSTAVGALQHRRSPVVLARIDGELFGAGLAAAIAASVQLWLGRGIWTPGMTWLPIALCALFVANAAVSITVLAVLGISRARNAFEWSLIDFIAEHDAGEAEPATDKERDARDLRALLED